MSDIFKLYDYQPFGNIFVGSARITEEDKLWVKAVKEIIHQKIVTFEKLENNDERAKREHFINKEDFGTHLIYKVSSTEDVYDNRGKWLITHPEGEKYMFYFYDEEHLRVSKPYDTEEECREAWERIQAHCNKIVFELPREEV